MPIAKAFLFVLSLVAAGTCAYYVYRTLQASVAVVPNFM